MSDTFNNFMSGLAFGMLANNPFFGGMSCGFCYGGYSLLDIVDFGTFANPFPAVSNADYVEKPSVFTTFANPFPSFDFTGVCQSIWDMTTNPNSDYNKKMKEYYENWQKQSEQQSKDNKTFIPQMQFPFSSFYMPTQITMNPYITGLYQTQQPEKVQEPKDNDADKTKETDKKYETFTNKYNDKRFNKFLSIILDREGGYANNKSDRGGETLKGITHTTYDKYRESKKLPTQSVTKMTDDEMQEIYYEMYYIASGADKISDKKLALYVFDTAVNMGVGRAKEFLNACMGDINKFEQLRKNKYKEIIENDATQKANEEGWNNRMAKIKKAADNELDTIA